MTAGGKLDLATAATFRAHLRMAVVGAGGIMLDLRDLRYLDSSGINTLLEIHRVLSPFGRRIALVRPSSMVRRVLGVLDLESLMPVFSTIADALTYLRFGDSLPQAGS